MNLTLKALGALLTYPDAVLLRAVPDIFQALQADPRLTPDHLAGLRSLHDYLTTTDPWALEESYVERFDTGRATSLHIFEDVHGESKDRGQAMVDLKTHYEAAGLQLAPNELPDFLPAFLEFLSLQPAATVGEFLADCSHVLEALGARLTERGSAYAAVFPILLSLATRPSSETVPAVKPEKSLDEEWAEVPAFAGSSCTGAP